MLVCACIAAQIITQSVTLAARPRGPRGQLTFGGHADPVEVSRELLGNVGLATSWEAHHHDDGRRVGKVGGASCCQEEDQVTEPVYRQEHLKTNRAAARGLL